MSRAKGRGPRALGPGTLGPGTLGPGALGLGTLGPGTLGPETLGPRALGPGAPGLRTLSGNWGWGFWQMGVSTYWQILHCRNFRFFRLQFIVSLRSLAMGFAWRLDLSGDCVRLAQPQICGADLWRRSAAQAAAQICRSAAQICSADLQGCRR